MHSHTYWAKAKEGQQCFLCQREFEPGETIRDHRSTECVNGLLLCWNEEACVGRARRRENRKVLKGVSNE